MSTVLNVKIDPRVKIKARRVAEELGLSLSAVVNVYLRQFINSESLFASTRQEEPSEWLLGAIREAEADIEAGRVKSFESGNQAVEFLRRRRLTGKSR